MRSIEDLLDSLITTTEESKLAWEREAGERYIASLPRHRIRVWQWTDENDGSAGITVQLLSKSGDVLDYISADQFRSIFGDLGKLYLVARRSALGVSNVISEVEEELLALKRTGR
jgi:hypothetical protein